MNNESKILSGFILGALAGGAVGILFAPMSGKRTRKKIQKQTQRLVDDAKDTLVDAADDVVVKVNEGIQDLSTKSKDSIEKLREKIVN